MFGDQIKLHDNLTIQLACSHILTGGEMKCVRCGEYPEVVVKNQIVEHSTIEWTDGLEYLKSHDV